MLVKGFNHIAGLKQSSIISMHWN